MVCIAAFIIFAILGIFSARYRRAAKRAWQCVGRRLTLRPCDTTIKDDIKNRLLGKLIIKRPRLARFLDRWIEVLAFIFIVLTIWSLLVVVKSGLNLYVYGTCNPNQAESCSIGAEACSIGTETPGFWSSIKKGRPDKWAGSEFSGFVETLSLIPSRMQEWKSEEYFGVKQSYYRPQDSSKPTALEIIDPGCKFCAALFANIKEAGFENRYNLTYIAYPIPDPTAKNGYKFQNSYLIASYLEAAKMIPLEGAETPSDWQILERLFTWQDDKGASYQVIFNGIYTEAQAGEKLKEWLHEIGYGAGEISRIEEAAHSETVRDRLAQNKEIVEDRIHTVKIPTIIFDGKRRDGVQTPDQLR